jgi:hypothetical protein
MTTVFDSVMKVVIPVWLIGLAAGLAFGLWYLTAADAPSYVAAIKGPLISTLFGGLGGAAYCLRAVYLNLGVDNRWSRNWFAWYFIRPIVSLIIGGVSYALLKAGLLLLDAERVENGLNYGFIAMAFIAGFNVDRFVRRMEEAAQATFGIRPSRTSERTDDRP